MVDHKIFFGDENRPGFNGNVGRFFVCGSHDSEIYCCLIPNYKSRVGALSVLDTVIDRVITPLNGLVNIPLGL